MKNIKILAIMLFAFLATISIYAQSSNEKLLYRSGVYGQIFELYELRSNDDGGVMLFLELKDNLDTNKSNIRFYDNNLPTEYFISSGIITNAKEYSTTVAAIKDFFDYALNLVSLADLKDICDLTRCCKLMEYCVETENNGRKHILIDYECSDLKLLFKNATEYNRRGRAYVLEKNGIY